MTGADSSAAAIPPPLDTDDDDVAWALQTAAVQWKLGAREDALVWLRRAVDSAIDAGQPERAAQINRLEKTLSEQLPKAAAAPDPGEGPATPFDSPFSDADGLMSVDDDELTPTRTDVLDDSELEAREVSLLPYEIEDVADVAATASRATGVRPVLESIPDDAGELSPMPLEDDEDPDVDEPTSGGRAALAPPAPPPVAGRPQVSLPPRPAPGGSRPVPGGGPPTPSRPQSPSTPASTLSSVAPGRSLAPRAPASGSRPAPPPRVSASHAAPTDVPAGGVGANVPPPGSSQRHEIEPAPLEEPSTGEPAPSSAPDVVAMPSLEGMPLADVVGLQDLPEDAQRELVRSVRIERLETDEEVSAFGVALVLDGWVNIMPTIADAACARASRGEVVFTNGTLDEHVALRVVAGLSGTRVAVWEQAAIDDATADCPWVRDELLAIADRFQALAGACMGPMGDRLDDSLRWMVTSRCEIKTLLPGDIVIEGGRPMPGLFIVGSGTLSLVDAAGSENGELASGEFVFAAQVLSGAVAPATVRAGAGGALVLFAARKTAHELIMVVPPLLEILAG